MSNLAKKVDALMRLVASEDGPSYDKAKAEVLRLMNGSEKPAVFDLENEVREALTTLGVPEHIKGHAYLVTAIMAVVEDKNLVNYITTKLYPLVAKAHDTTGSRVEWAIRHGIELAWQRCDIDVLHEYFDYTISPSKGKPANSEFIARLAGIIRRQMQEVS